jgi:alpha-L-fucosidase
MGKWLEINGEVIYGTRPWIKSGKGSEEGISVAFTDNEESQYTAQDIRFTSRGDTLYAIALAWTDGDITIHSVVDAGNVKDVSMLGSEENIIWNQSTDGLILAFPDTKPSNYAHAFRIELD